MFEDQPITGISPVAPLQAERVGNEVLLSIGGLQPFPARLESYTSVAAGVLTRKAWTWVEVAPTPGGGWADVEDGRTGSYTSAPAFESGSFEWATAGMVVRLYPGAFADENGAGVYGTEFDWGFEWFFDVPEAPLCVDESPIPGFLPTRKQLLGHDENGCQIYYDVEECDSIADGITVDTTPVTGGTNGDVLVIDSGLVSAISTVNLLIAAGGIATAGTVGA